MSQLGPYTVISDLPSCLSDWRAEGRTGARVRRKCDEGQGHGGCAQLEFRTRQVVDQTTRHQVVLIPTTRNV